MNNKKYQLKPGLHQFVPGSAAVHHNDALTDAEAEWYIEKYPHIKNLFILLPPEGGEKESIKQSVKSSKKSVESQK